MILEVISTKRQNIAGAELGGKTNLEVFPDPRQIDDNWYAEIFEDIRLTNARHFKNLRRMYVSGSKNNFSRARYIVLDQASVNQKLSILVMFLLMKDLQTSTPLIQNPAG
jgi:hypothetical protein